MPCYKPLKAFKSLTKKTESGKALISFKSLDIGFKYDLIELPCGQCIGCRIERSKQWALRCVHEASLYENNCFLTLTFNDECINDKGTLVKSDFQNFMKRMRKHHSGAECVINDKGLETYPIRYFHCGEYGEKLTRPHHHACLFNFDFSDKVHWSTRSDVKLYRSPTLEKRWGNGFATIGDVTFESAAYVARYITKKINGEKAAEHYERINPESGEVYKLEPEYITMSRRPGIGKRWFDTYKSDCYPADYLIHNAKKYRVPAFYDKIYDQIEGSNLESIKQERMRKATVREIDNTPRRLAVREKVQELKGKRLIRSIEQ